MIRLHSGVAVNPMNVVSVKKDGNDIVVFLWNGRVHKLQTDNPAMEYIRVKDELAAHIDMIWVELDHAVNVDAIVSVAKVENGISINLVTGNRIMVHTGAIDGAFDGIVRDADALAA